VGASDRGHLEVAIAIVMFFFLMAGHPTMVDAAELMKQKDRELLLEQFRDLTGEVTILMFTQEIECQYCSQTRELLTEMAALSSKLKLTVLDFVHDREEAERYGVDKIPATVLLADEDRGIKYYGVPAGYELTALVETIVDLSSNTTSLSDSSKAQLKALEQDVHIQVFVTPTCPYCPKAVRIAYMLAQESEHIRADVIEGIEFPHLANKYHVRGVPTVVIDESTSFVGAQSEAFFVEKILKATR